MHIELAFLFPLDPVFTSLAWDDCANGVLASAGYVVWRSSFFLSFFFCVFVCVCVCSGAHNKRVNQQKHFSFHQTGLFWLRSMPRLSLDKQKYVSNYKVGRWKQLWIKRTVDCGYACWSGIFLFFSFFFYLTLFWWFLFKLSARNGTKSANDVFARADRAFVQSDFCCD